MFLPAAYIHDSPKKRKNVFTLDRKLLEIKFSKIIQGANFLNTWLCVEKYPPS